MEKGRILIIDEDKLFRDMTSESLKEKDLSTTLVDDGQTGIATAKKEKFDLVILNAHIPGLSGLDTLMALKKFCPELPVIMVSAKESAETYRESMRLGAEDYLIKPVATDKLMRSLNKVIEQKEHLLSEAKWLEGIERLRKGTEKLRHDLNEKEAFISQEKIKNFFQTVVDMIAEVLQVKTVSLMTINQTTQTLVLGAAHGLNPNLIYTVAKPVGEGFAGMVAQSGEPLLIKDLESDERFDKSKYSFQYETPSLLCVPIVVKGKVEGVINVNNKEDKSPFNDRDLTLLTMFAHNVEFLMENINLYFQLEERLKDLTLLYQINRKISETMNFSTLVEDFLHSVHDAFGVEASSLLLLKEDKETLYFRAVIGIKPALVKGIKVAVGEGLSGWCVQNKKPALCNDTETDPRHSPSADKYTGFKTKTILCAPLILSTNVMGVIELINKKDGAPFTERERSLLEAIASQTVLVLRNSYLHGSLSKQVKEAIASQKRETELKSTLEQKLQEIEKLKGDSVITFRIEDME
ncbi:GAF domain-containing protein [candidate division CSSED10-310 bacterium]|uniref:GAF domain-containing protein n=1 Tax=candidate division CSSED10-310 bacterium TaxID=2855610 RepID=A0ABV6YVA7_UNCC1